ncbi:portal protein [Arthrobacter phage Tillums]|nr:portal protein [Arthrobacter phage Tillums]
MAKNQDLVFTEFYAPHLNGGRKNNAVINKQVLLERMYMRLLTEMAANRFEWSGLPDSVDKRFLELSLTNRALAVFYWDNDVDQFLAVQGSGAGHTNFLDNPVSFTVIGPGIGAGHSKTLRAVPDADAECVPIWANYMRCPDWDIITIYAAKLATIDRTIEITANNMRKTKIVAAAESERLSYENILKAIAEGQEKVMGTKGIVDLNAAIQVLDLGVEPQLLSELQIGRTRLWSECMGLLGINNANQDKKERLVAAEVGANDEQVQATRNIALNARQYACEQINKRWPNLSVSVDFKKPPAEPVEESQSQQGTREEVTQ